MFFSTLNIMPVNRQTSLLAKALMFSLPLAGLPAPLRARGAVPGAEPDGDEVPRPAGLAGAVREGRADGGRQSLLLREVRRQAHGALQDLRQVAPAGAGGAAQALRLRLGPPGCSSSTTTSSSHGRWT